MAANKEMGVEDARKSLGDLVTAAARDNQITVISKNGVPAAALVPLAFLLELSDTSRKYRELAKDAIGALGKRS